MGAHELKSKKNKQKEDEMLKTSSLIKIDLNISNVSKSICKIKIKNPIGTKYDTGFLLRIYIDQEAFYCLVYNELIISKDIMNNEDNIYIYII